MGAFHANSNIPFSKYKKNKCERNRIGNAGESNASDFSYVTSVFLSICHISITIWVVVLYHYLNFLSPCFTTDFLCFEALVLLNVRAAAAEMIQASENNVFILVFKRSHYSWTTLNYFVKTTVTVNRAHFHSWFSWVWFAFCKSY